MAGKITTEIDNYMAIVHDLARGAEQWLSRPAWLEFAPNNLCNLRCVMCGQADGVPLVVMKREDAARLLDGLLPTISLWTPSALSEPMLADIKQVIQKCREHEVWLNLYSNATVLDGKRFLEICDRIQKLHISFDSHHKQVLESLRVRANFEEVVQHIKEILPLAAARGVPVGFVAVLMADNLLHLAEFIDFLADIGAADARCDLRVQPMLYNAKGCEGRNVTDRFTPAEIERELDRACERARARKINFFSEFDDPFRRAVTVVPPHIRGIMPDMLIHMTETIRQRYPHFCRMASYYVKIEPDGRVFPCCRAPNELEMGNVKEQEFEQIWNGDKYRGFRRRMHARDYPEVCRTCDVLVANPHFDQKSLTQAPATPP